MQHLWQQLRRGLRWGTDYYDIGLGNNGRQIQTETINEPQSQPALKRGRTRTPGNEISAPVATFQRTSQGPGNQPETQKRDYGVVISVHDQMGARG